MSARTCVRRLMICGCLLGFGVLQTMAPASASSRSTVASSRPGAIVVSPVKITHVTTNLAWFMVTFTGPVTVNGAKVTNYQFSVNGGKSWKTQTPASTKSPLKIFPSLAPNAHCVLELRAVSSKGKSAPSAPVAAIYKYSN